jgi:glycosyltransferase involved in cell wall biosynthesis
MLQHLPIHRIPNGVDGDVFAPASRSNAREQLGIPQDARVLLFSAHMLDANPRKGGNVLIQALQSIGARSGWHLALLGEGGSSWQAQCPIPVHMLGFRSESADIARCYAVADVVVVPSVLENLPNTLLEALACGRAVVASDCGGIRDGVIEGTTGLLVPQDDALKLAAALISILTNDALQVQMERSARELFEREFSAALEIDRFEALYRQVIERSGMSAPDPMVQR